MTVASTTPNFTPRDLASYAGVVRFLNGEEQAQRIIELSKDPELSKEKPLYTYWDVAKQVATLPFYLEINCGIASYAMAYISQLFGFTKIAEGAKTLAKKCLDLHLFEYAVAKISAFALRTLGAKSWSESAANLEKWAWNIFSHSFSDLFRFFTQFLYGSSYLASAKNVQREDNYSFYIQPEVPNNELTGLKKADIPVRKAGFQFYNPDGSCLGMSLWFIQLYLKTKEKVTCTARAHMRAITELFSKGAGPHETLLQNFQNTSNGAWSCASPWLRPSRTKEPFQISSDDWWKGNLQNFRSMAKNTPYLLFMDMSRMGMCGARHAAVCIKTSDTSGYIFDPNHGTREFTGKDWEKQAASFLFSQWHTFLRSVDRVIFFPFRLRE